jgi:tyrosyl-tRNA synthetase
MELAREIVSIFHSDDAARQAEAHFVTVFQQRDLPDDMPIYHLKEPMNVIDLMADAGLTKSKSEGRRLVQQGGVRLDGQPVPTIDTQIEVSNEAVLQIGRRKFTRLVAKY